MTAPELNLSVEVPGTPEEVWKVIATGEGIGSWFVPAGFENMEGWDGDFDALANGWRIFMNNLRLHCTHFAGQAARAIVPSATIPGPNAPAWKQLTGAFGIADTFAPGDHLATDADGLPTVAGVVDSFVRTDMVTVVTVVIDQPCPGTAFIAAEGSGDQIAVSIYLYLYGPDAASIDDRWSPWLASRFAPVDDGPAGE